MSTSYLESSPAQNFMHKPFDSQNTQIRLLRLANPDMDPVTLTIEAFDLEECPPYYALSYMWGPPEPNQNICIDGYSFKIRENLWHFLYNVRKVRKKAVTTDLESVVMAVDYR